MFKKIFNKISFIVEWIITLLLVLLIVLTAFQRFSNQGSFFGYRIYTVASGSMIPTYDIGDTLLIKEMSVTNLKVGDAVTYIGESGGIDGKIITHQIQKIEIDENGSYSFHTKGIANNIEDPIVSENQVIGKVIHKFFFLSIVGKLTTNMVTLLLFITVPIAILIAIEIIKLVYKNDDSLEEEQIEDKVDTEAKKDDIILNDSSAVNLTKED